MLVQSDNWMLVQIGLGLRPRPIVAVLGIFFIQLFPNWTACSPITYTNFASTAAHLWSLTKRQVNFSGA